MEHVLIKLSLIKVEIINNFVNKVENSVVCKNITYNCWMTVYITFSQP